MDLFSSLADTLAGLFTGNPPAPPSRTFSASYRVLPMVFSGKDHLDMGNKVILPPSALAKLTKSNIEYPMMFSLTNDITTEKTHVGVMEFSAPEGVAYLPLLVMRNLSLETDGHATFTSIVLPRGQYVKIQPHRTAFIDLSNPKAVLEKSLRSFSCLTAGETFNISYADQEFDIDVLEVRPNRLGAISLIDTDVQVEFEAPKDYVEPKRTDFPVPVAAMDANLSPSTYNYDDKKESTVASTPKIAIPLSERPGGYRLSDTSASVPDKVVQAADSSTTSESTPRRTTVVQGQWQYIYETDPSTQRRRLVRRDPLPSPKKIIHTGHSLK